MALLLHIDTATAYAGVCLSNNGQLLGMKEHADQKNHASFLQPAIQILMKDAGKTFNEIDAIAVTAGPGSYTGIRVGLASAKGICFALQKPLILINTLQVIAKAALEKIGKESDCSNTLIYPMIDARRMEVFTSVYNHEMLEISKSRAIILDDTFFNSLPSMATIAFCGDGSLKIPPECIKSNRVIINSQHHVNQMITIAEQDYEAGNFANLAYSEPLYVKEFYQAPK